MPTPENALAVLFATPECAPLIKTGGLADVSAALPAALRGLGLWGIPSQEKFIPEVYVTASRGVRLELLSGLLDTDGWVEKWGSARFCSTSERFATMSWFG